MVEPAIRNDRELTHGWAAATHSIGFGNMPAACTRRKPPITEPAGALAVDRRRAGVLGLFLLMPLALVFVEAFRDGVAGLLRRLGRPRRAAAIRLTLLAAAVAVPIGTIFGVAAAWAIAKFEFVGKSLLVTLIDLPFSVSPVIAGLIFVLLFGRGRLVRAVARGRTTFASSSPCRALCWPRCS